MGYCARADVFALGLPAEVFARPPRRVDGIVPSTGTIQLRSHGLSAGAPVTLAVLSSTVMGAPASAPPAGLSVGTAYYWQPNGSDMGQLSTTPTGPAIASFGDAGSGALGILVDSGPDLDAAIEAATTVLNEHARAHTPPIAAPVLPFVCAYLAARIYVASHAPMNPAYAEALEGPSWLRSLIDALFKLWLQGADLVGATDATPKVAEMGWKAVRLQGRGFLRGEREELA